MLNRSVGQRALGLRAGGPRAAHCGHLRFSVTWLVKETSQSFNDSGVLTIGNLLMHVLRCDFFGSSIYLFLASI